MALRKGLRESTCMVRMLPVPSGFVEIFFMPQQKCLFIENNFNASVIDILYDHVGGVIQWTLNVYQLKKVNWYRAL